MLLHLLCTALEFSDVLDFISSHYRESQYGTRRRQSCALRAFYKGAEGHASFLTFSTSYLLTL